MQSDILESMCVLTHRHTHTTGDEQYTHTHRHMLPEINSTCTQTHIELEINSTRSNTPTHTYPHT